VGLTTALVVLRTGWVIVGSLPTSNGMSPTAKAGCLLILNNQGRVVTTFSGGPIHGPWDMTVFDGGNLVALFVINVLNGTMAASPNVVHKGTVVRIIASVSNEHVPRILLTTVIGSGFAERTDSAALVVGPTGLALDADNDQLFVADSANSRIASISNPLSRRSSAGVGATVSQEGAINDPLGLTRAPNGNLIAANGGNGNLVEISPNGQQAAHKLVDKSGSPPGSGALFGLTTTTNSVVFVDDATNTLNVLHQ
jgi:DNA-binding beta-propeller fold protein YncE